jgi:tetratricopeptide (TPR) repeat protein
MSTSKSTLKDQVDSSETLAQIELKRAYLHVSFGQYDQGIEACERAADAAPDHYLPATLRGSFEMAAGRVRDALGTLRPVTRRYPDEALPRLYFAEACFLAGRHRQGERALNQAYSICQKQSDESPSEQVVALLDELRRTWESVEPVHVPPPLVVNLDH